MKIVRIAMLTTALACIIFGTAVIVKESMHRPTPHVDPMDAS